MLQMISVLGALAILGAYAASQFRLRGSVAALLPGRELPGLRGAHRRGDHSLAARVHPAGRDVGTGEPVGDRIDPSKWQHLAQRPLKLALVAEGAWRLTTRAA